MPDQPLPPPTDAELALALPTGPTAPAEARRAVGTALRQWRLDGLVDRVLLTVSELVTNALRHGRPPVVLRLVRGAQVLRVDVHDDAPGAPPGDRRPAPDDAESGRGMAIVEALADDEGVEQVEGDGKHVWATFRTPEPPS